MSYAEWNAALNKLSFQIDQLKAGYEGDDLIEIENLLNEAKNALKEILKNSLAYSKARKIELKKGIPVPSLIIRNLKSTSILIPFHQKLKFKISLFNAMIYLKSNPNCSLRELEDYLEQTK